MSCRSAARPLIRILSRGQSSAPVSWSVSREIGQHGSSKPKKNWLRRCCRATFRRYWKSAVSFGPKGSCRWKVERSNSEANLLRGVGWAKYVTFPRLQTNCCAMCVDFFLKQTPSRHDPMVRCRHGIKQFLGIYGVRKSFLGVIKVTGNDTILKCYP